MTQRLKSIGYSQLHSDNAVFVRKRSIGTAITAIHVDNMVTIADSTKELGRARKRLFEVFEMKEEDPNWMMGFQLIEDTKEQTISISHERYIETVLNRFNMSEAKPHPLPMDPGCVLSKEDRPQTEAEKEDMENVPYQELVGALTWISLISRPDIAFASRYLGQYSANPGRKHWKAALHVLRYLSGTRSMQLVLGGKSKRSMELIGYTDSDWARDVDDRRSISGTVFQLGGRTIAHGSKKQITVATSSTEGEYMAAAYAAKLGLWLIQILAELGHPFDNPICINIDNTASLNLTKDARYHARTKHIDIQHHFIRERVIDGTFVVTHLSTSEMVADILTKPLIKESFYYLLPKLGLYNPSE